MIPRSALADHLLFALFISCFGVLAFIAGVTAAYFHLAPAEALHDSLEGGKAWFEHRESAAPLPPARDADDAVANAKVTWDRDHAFNGYTLITIRYSATAFLVDMEGHVVHRWDMPFHKAWPNPTHVAKPVAEDRIYFEKAELLPNGDLIGIYEAWGDTPYGYGMVKMDKHSHMLWTYEGRTHHDLYIDRESGNIYTLVQSFVTTPLPGLAGLSYPLLADAVVILSPEGKELKRISILEAFRDSSYALMLYHPPTNHLRWDPLHTNSVMKLEPAIADRFPMFKAGQILVSLHNTDTVAVIDPDSGKVVWAYDGLWKGQHAARFLPNGHIMLLDNLGHEAAGKIFSRLIEFDPVAMVETWHYAGNPEHPFYTFAYGRAQWLPNDDILVAESLHSRLFEVNRKGTIVWEYALPVRYKKMAPDLPPYNTNIPPWAMDNDRFNEHVAMNPNLDTVIVNATRYAPDALPFLKNEVVDKGAMNEIH